MRMSEGVRAHHPRTSLSLKRVSLPEDQSSMSLLSSPSSVQPPLSLPVSTCSTLRTTPSALQLDRNTEASIDTASKGAVLAMTRELAMVHAREGIRFNSLCPYVPSVTVIDL